MSINPYQDLSIHKAECMDNYRNCQRSERPAHLFALVNSAYRVLEENSLNSCLIISGKKYSTYSFLSLPID